MRILIIVDDFECRHGRFSKGQVVEATHSAALSMIKADLAVYCDPSDETPSLPKEEPCEAVAE